MAVNHLNQENCGPCFFDGSVKGSFSCIYFIGLKCTCVWGGVTLMLHISIDIWKYTHSIYESPGAAGGRRGALWAPEPLNLCPWSLWRSAAAALAQKCSPAGFRSLGSCGLIMSSPETSTFCRPRGVFFTVYRRHVGESKARMRINYFFLILS